MLNFTITIKLTKTNYNRVCAGIDIIIVIIATYNTVMYCWHCYHLIFHYLTIICAQIINQRFVTTRKQYNKNLKNTISNIKHITKPIFKHDLLL